jgi:hypothetical protein
MSPNAGNEGLCGVLANENSCTCTGAQINFGDLTPYLTNDLPQQHFLSGSFSPGTLSLLHTVEIERRKILENIPLMQPVYRLETTFPSVRHVRTFLGLEGAHSIDTVLLLGR